ncbi:MULTISPECIES: nuclear transport factor 2 family protein [Rheinheimera]|uniref:Nuclear transport factor 2 family protein n=1 Tax=Rheinheimera marina TaxID=1774958 RepID=A0ABV9JN28_9GAMM
MPAEFQTSDAADTESAAYPLWLQRFTETYQALGVASLEPLAQLYRADIQFRDPLHQLQGLDALLAYFSGLYSKLSQCDFQIDSVIYQGNSAALYWTMTYAHPQLNKGLPIRVEGHSLIRGEADKVHYHRDYLDAGQMLYEHLPAVGALIRWVKRRASQ